MVTKAHVDGPTVQRCREGKNWRHIWRHLSRGTCNGIHWPPDTWAEKFESFWTDRFDTRNKRKFWLMQTHVNGWFPSRFTWVCMSAWVHCMSLHELHEFHVNGWFPAVYMSCMSQNFRLFLVSNLSVQTFELFCSCIRGHYSPESIWVNLIQDWKDGATQQNRPLVTRIYGSRDMYTWASQKTSGRIGLGRVRPCILRFWAEQRKKLTSRFTLARNNVVHKNYMHAF